MPAGAPLDVRPLSAPLGAVEPADAVFVVIHSRLRRAPGEYERVLDLGLSGDLA